MSHSISDERPDYGETFEQFRCLDKTCRHRGPALAKRTVNREEFWGAPVDRVSLEDPVCEACLGSNIVEITD